MMLRWLVAAVVSLLFAGTGAAGAEKGRWVAAWAASPVVGSVIPWSDCPAGVGLRDQTVRNVVFLSTGGDRVRIRVSNVFGASPLRVGRASVAVRDGDARAVAGTMRTLTFGGRTATTVPAGGTRFSDPVRLRVPALSTLLVSVYVPGPTGPVTNHPFTAQGNYLADGDLAEDPTGAGYGTTPCWMLVDGVDVAPVRTVRGTVVALGDSITDTSATTGDANRRWPDFLARRLDAVDGPTFSVVNAGLGGNRVLAPRDGEPYFGVSALERLDRDVFGQTGVRTVILMEGVNDIGFDATADELIAGLREIVDRTHAEGLRIIGGTITPFGGSFIWTEARERTWTLVNDWIRTSGAFDGVADFAAATAADGNPLTLDPAYDSGDHLHPNDAGTEAMAEAVDLSLLLPHRAPALATPR